MRIFLIDFENTHYDGLSGLDCLNENDKIIIFYSINSDKISFELLKKIVSCKAMFDYFKITKTGHNALDFQLATYLGSLVIKQPEAEFYIISKDTGLDFITDFWNSNHTEEKPVIKRCLNIKQAINTVDFTANQLIKKDKKNDTTENLLNNFGTLHELYINIVKEFGQKSGVKIYHSIKPRFVAKHKKKG